MGKWFELDALRFATARLVPRVLFGALALGLVTIAGIPLRAQLQPELL